jgi:sialate O-acetylesterase
MMKSKNVKIVFALAALMLTGFVGLVAAKEQLKSDYIAGGLRLPNIFANGMVLQRDKPVSVWGWAKPKSVITVEFAGQSKSATAGDDSKWSVKLDALNASSDSRTLIVRSGNKKLALDNVLVGEVWVCGGQSNMEWKLRSTRDADIELAAADYPQIRFIRLPKIAHIKPQEDFTVENENSPTGNWRTATAAQVENCTGVGYYFARRLHRNLKVPVGIIDNSWGGTMAQNWCSKESLANIPEMKDDINKFEAKLKKWIDGGREAGAKKRLTADLAEWEKARAAAKAKGERQPGRPNPKSYDNPALAGQPGGMFNGSLAPFTNMTVRGVLFYQGENNSFGNSWKPFHRTFATVISDWRAAFGQPDMPFGIIQIAGWSTRRSMSYDMNHHCNVVREIQFDIWQKTPNTGLIVTFDTNSDSNIHPKRKEPVGERSARWALAEVYDAKRAGSNSPLEWCGPVYESTEFADGKAYVSFKAASDSGLRFDKGVDVGFVIAGEDKVFHNARARVAANKNRRQQVIVWCDAVSKPVAVRYAQSNLPIGYLMNGRELRAFPFRSDNWPITPHQSTGSYVREK